MAWRDNYRAATFRGVGFFVSTADSTHGRRQAVHETAQRDVPYTEDLGRKAREFNITGYLLGKEYDVARETLIAACEQAGPGVLVHPYRGELTVVCRGLTVSESTEEGGKCTLSITFLEAGEVSFPSAKVDSVNAISKKSGEVSDTARHDFASTFTTKGYPAFVAEAAVTELQAFSEYLGAKQIGSQAFDLVQQPLELARQVVGAVDSMRAAFGGRALNALIGLYDQYDAFVDGKELSRTVRSLTPSRQRMASNTQALGSLIRHAAIAQASMAAVVTQTTVIIPNGFGGGTDTTSAPAVYDSYDAALAVRTELADRLDDESEATDDDFVYVALTGLRTAVMQAVPSAEHDLPRLARYVPRQTLPSLLVAYQLYGDAARELDIVTRNDPRRPGFLTGGQQLEVLTDG